MNLLKKSMNQLSSNKKVLPNTASSKDHDSFAKKITLNNEEEYLVKFKPVAKKIYTEPLNKIKTPLQCF